MPIQQEPSEGFIISLYFFSMKFIFLIYNLNMAIVGDNLKKKKTEIKTTTKKKTVQADL